LRTVTYCTENEETPNASMVTGAWSVLSATVAATAGFFAGKKA
jgi:2-methylisocitrate lyase-like PEP mutase family enzyme